jgi:hypothetical protein
MPGRKPEALNNPKAPTSQPLRETPLDPAGEVEVIYRDLPPRPPEDKKIHQRRPLPRVPEAPAEDADEAK